MSGPTCKLSLGLGGWLSPTPRVPVAGLVDR